MFTEKIYKMQHLEDSGTSVLYIGRTVLKGYLWKPYKPFSSAQDIEFLDKMSDCKNITMNTILQISLVG